jgi:hypothetical protein
MNKDRPGASGAHEKIVDLINNEREAKKPESWKTKRGASS